MQKQIFCIISMFSMLLTFVPAPKIAQAAPVNIRLGFDITSTTVTEGDLVYVKLKRGSSDNAPYIDVYYSISGTANNSDYTLDNNLGVFRLTGDELSVPLYSIDEGGGVEAANETVIITLQAAIDSNNQDVAIDQNKKVYTHTIKNNNGLPRLSFLYNTSSSNESDTAATFRVYLSRAPAANVSFQWMFADAFSTATNQPTVLNGHTFPADVTLPASVWQNATIPAGQSFIDIPLGLQNDSLYEESEAVTLIIGGQISNAVLGQENSQIYTILDEDQPAISFQPTSSSGQENVGNVNLTIGLSKALQYDLNMTLAADQVQSTARPGGVDWTLPLQVGPLKILAGATSVNASITIVDDNEQEGNETAVVSITSIVPAVGDPIEFGPGSSIVYTYTIVDNDVLANPPGGGTGTPTPPTVPPGMCPTLSPGDMVKVSGKAAIYVVNRLNKIMYFPSGDEFKSWNEGEGYGGYVTITQDCFDNGLTVPNTPPMGINFRPGSYVIKKENNNQLYAVLPGNKIAKISPEDAKALYGANYKVMTVKFIFWSNYASTAGDINGKAHSGMLVQKDNKVWYVDGNTLREVPANQMSANRFKSAFVHAVPSSYLAGFTVGTPISGAVTEIVNRTQL